MKLQFLFAAAAALAMVSCSKTEQAGITSMESDGPVPVSFTSYTGRTLTKANASLNQSFNVAAFQSGLTPYVYYFPPTVYKYSGGSYMADTVRYWPKTGGLDFYAVSPTAYKRTDAVTDTLLKVSADTTITVSNTDGATDIVADSLMKVANGTEPVALKFGHKLTKVAFKAKGADSLLSYIVKGISVKANSTGKYHFGEPGKWDGGTDAYDYVYISETTKDTIPAGQSGAKAMGTAKYLIPAQGDKVEAAVSYSVYYGNNLLEENTDVAVSLPVTDVWGVNQSVVYTLTLSVSAKKVSFTADVLEWGAETDVPQYPEAPELPCVKIGDIWWAPVNCGYDANHKYGLLYQWGRKVGSAYGPASSGEESGYQTAIAATWPDDGCTKNPVNSEFYTYVSTTDPKRYDWYTNTQSKEMKKWPMEAPSGTTGIGDPCPSGWRVPTMKELQTLNNSGSSKTTQGGVSGRLYGGRVFLPASGYRNCADGTALNRNIGGAYWSSSVYSGGIWAWAFCFDLPSTPSEYYGRANGGSVRCVR